MATVHPSSILRAPDEEKRRQAREDFIADMTKVAEVIHRAKGKRQRTAALQDVTVTQPSAGRQSRGGGVLEL